MRTIARRRRLLATLALAALFAGVSLAAGGDRRQLSEEFLAAAQAPCTTFSETVEPVRTSAGRDMFLEQALADARRAARDHDRKADEAAMRRFNRLGERKERLTAKLGLRSCGV